MATEEQQKIHRIFNTVISIIVLLMMILIVNPAIDSANEIYDQLSGAQEERIERSEIARIVDEESYVPTPYKDSLGYWTVGFGHLIKDGEQIKAVTSHEAVAMLRADYTEAKESVERNYKWAEGDVKLVLINMTYQMGASRVSKFTKTLAYLKSKQYDLAAGEMLDSVWASQTPKRAARLAARIMQLEE